MNKFGKKLSIIFVMAFAIMVGCFNNNVFAADDAEIGTANLNNTTENSAKLGDQLLHPEKGWKRYDDSNKNINYQGKYWLISNNDLYYNKSRHDDGNDLGAKIKFNFIGSGIRLIDYLWNNRTQNSVIKIDGISYPLSAYSDNNSSAQSIFYMKIGLDYKEHYVEIILNDNKGLCFDAIDIDATGELKPYNENTSTIISSIILNKSTDNLQVGQADTLIATVTPDNVTNKNVTWKSSDESIATVDQTGKVTAIKEGTATITATTTDGSNLSASCTVNVTSQGTTPTNPTDNSDNAILTITMTNDNVKSYTVPMTKVNDFISWYDNRVSGSAGKAYYIFDKTDNLQPFSKKTEYIIFDKISSYEVDEYKIQK